MCYEKRDAEQARACFERDQRKTEGMAEYIEKEALIDVLAVSHASHANTSREASLLYRDIRLIREQPAADVAPVVHGRWVETKKGNLSLWNCSECKTLGSPQWKGCPVCLARMDGE